MRIAALIVSAVFCMVLVASSVYAAYANTRIVSNTDLGGIAVGGLTREQAQARLQEAFDTLSSTGIQIAVAGTPSTIALDDIGADINIEQAVDAAFIRGHRGGIGQQLFERVSSIWQKTSIETPVHVDDRLLQDQIDTIASTVDTTRKDIRLAVRGTTVTLLTDIATGRVIDRDQATQRVATALANFTTAPVDIPLRDDPPRADQATASHAVNAANRMLARPVVLTYEDAQFSISREKIGTWITSTYDDTTLQAGLNRQLIDQYVTTIASVLNVAPSPARITTEGGHVTSFVPPKVGKAVEEDKLAQMIVDVIMARASSTSSDVVVVPMKVAKVALAGLDGASGITELIGKATTPFTGSPHNRISNIKNGVKFLSGVIVSPGEEFSTLKTLGTIDNTSGYLPELVIKGDRTTPEFGGGLCQVSTTLFRAVLNAGLPVSARRNHSYRVSYYEKDGDGRVIGPGLDATIYQPDVDFRFMNDMKTPLLIIGYVVGDRVTFELYGTKDGRTSVVTGPKLLSETSPGEPVYIPTDTLPVGMKKQVETPHPGGTATATYGVTYADGHKATQTFSSYYRRWPAKYLIGTNTNCSTPAQCAALVATPPPIVQATQ